MTQRHQPTSRQLRKCSARANADEKAFPSRYRGAVPGAGGSEYNNLTDRARGKRKSLIVGLLPCVHVAALCADD